MRFTERRMFKFISRWQRSGVSQKAWCEKNGIAYPTFHYWYKRYRVKQAMTAPKDDEGKFVKLVMDTDNKASVWWCEVRLANGNKLVFREPLSPEILQTLIG